MYLLYNNVIAVIMYSQLSTLVYTYFTYVYIFIDSINISISKHQLRVCYGDTVTVSCSYGNLKDHAVIYRKVNPTVILWNNLAYNLSNDYTYNMKIEENSFENGLASVSCAVVYADGSIEKSRTFTVRKICKYIYI